jgi:predicted phosphodiesterase
MEIAIIADVHSNLPALEAVFDEIGELRIFSCGDIVGYNPYPNETVEIFRKRRIKGVMGNHDQGILTPENSRFNSNARKAILWTRKVLSKSNLGYLESLPTKFMGNGFTAFHGSPRDPLFEYVYEGFSEDTMNSFLGETEILVLAHTHLPFVRHLKKGIAFNPGSVGQPRDGDPRAAYAILNTDKVAVKIKRVAYDIERVASEIKKKGLPEELATRLYKGN